MPWQWQVFLGILVVYFNIEYGSQAYDNYRSSYARHFDSILVGVHYGFFAFLFLMKYRFFFPDSPANARFLTPTERAQAVQRIKQNQTGVENKKWKRDQLSVVPEEHHRKLFADIILT